MIDNPSLEKIARREREGLLMSVCEAVAITLNLETTVALTNGYSIFFFFFFFFLRFIGIPRTVSIFRNVARR